MFVYILPIFPPLFCSLDVKQCEHYDVAVSSRSDWTEWMVLFLNQWFSISWRTHSNAHVVCLLKGILQHWLSIVGEKKHSHGNGDHFRRTIPLVCHLIQLISSRDWIRCYRGTHTKQHLRSRQDWAEAHSSKLIDFRDKIPLLPQPTSHEASMNNTMTCNAMWILVSNQTLLEFHHKDYRHLLQ